MHIVRPPELRNAATQISFHSSEYVFYKFKRPRLLLEHQLIDQSSSKDHAPIGAQNISRYPPRPLFT